MQGNFIFPLLLIIHLLILAEIVFALWATACRSNSYQLGKQSCFRVTACRAVVSHNEHFLYSYMHLCLSVLKPGLLRQCVDQSAKLTGSVSLLNISSVFVLTADLASSGFIFFQIIKKCVEWFWTDEVLAELPEMLQLGWQFHIYISFWEATANAFFLCASGLMFCFHTFMFCFHAFFFFFFKAC